MKITDMVYYSPMENGASRHPSGWRAYARPHAIIFLAALFAMACQFAHPGFYSKVIEHAVMLPKYAVQFEKSLRQGVFYPRWMPDDFHGYGSPVFVFYSPLLFFLTAVVGLCGMDLAMSAILVKLLCLYAGGAFLFYFIRKPYGDRAALFAAALYILLPSRLVEFYLSNTPSGSFALAWMPAVLLFTRKLIEEPFKRVNLAGLAVAYSLLVLSHLATAYIFTPFIVFYAFLGTAGGPLSNKAFRLSLGIAAGIGLSAFFFSSAAFEQGYAQLGYLTREYDFKINFLFNPYHPTSTTIKDLDKLHEVMSYSIYFEAALATMLYYCARRFSGLTLARQVVALVVCLLAAIFMMTPLSGFFWERLPGLKVVAFPLLRFTTIYLLFLSAVLGLLLDGSSRPPQRPFVLAIVVTVVAAIVVYDAVLLSKSGCTPEKDAPRLAREVDLFPEYLPETVDPGALKDLRPDDPRLSSNDEYSAFVKRWDSIDRIFAVNAPRGARLRVKTFYFPGWRAWVDGKEVPLTAQERTGAILMDVPPGRHDVELKFTDTPPRTVGKIVSLLALVALFMPYRRRLGRER